MVTIFLTLSILAIVAGGLLSAFTARSTSRQTAWASAYLVLVVGVIQFGLLSLWQGLGQPRAGLVWWAFGAYNLGNIGVMVGTLDVRLKSRQLLVNVGGALIGLAITLLLIASHSSTVSLKLVAFIALTLVILVSMPIGLVLSSKRSRRRLRASARPR